MRRISATGTSHRGRGNRRNGPRSNLAFTLIEVLVVVAITGIIVALASVNLFPSDREVARREVVRVALAIEHTRDAAWFGGRPTAVSFADGRARLWRHSGREWQPDTARDTVLDPGLAVTAVTSDGQPIPPGERLVFLPDGLDDPFRVALEVRNLKWAVDGDAAGSIKVVER
jgi:type II secretion system protein H